MCCLEQKSLYKTTEGLYFLEAFSPCYCLQLYEMYEDQLISSESLKYALK